MSGKTIQIFLVGLNRAIETDIPTRAESGKPRTNFRGRQWVREFFEKHQTQPGDVLALERLSEREYRLYPFSTAKERKQEWHRFLDEPPQGGGPTVLEPFAGCGGLALGFKRAGFRTALAVEWDGDACDTLPANVTDRVANCANEEVEQFTRVDVVAGSSVSWS